MAGSFYWLRIQDGGCHNNGDWWISRERRADNKRGWIWRERFDWVRKKMVAATRQILTELGRAGGRGVQPMREVEHGGNASHWIRKIQDGSRQLYLLSSEEQLVEECSQWERLNMAGTHWIRKIQDGGRARHLLSAEEKLVEECSQKATQERADPVNPEVAWTNSFN